LPDNSEIETPFMHGHIPCNFYRSNDATILELPYANDKYSLVMVMPSAGQPLNSFISSLNSTTWQSWIGKLGNGYADVSMPKFQFTYSTSLKGELSAMGVSTAFSDAADFSNLSTSTALKITDVEHKAYIAVDETGTEAAAATTVIMGPTAAPANEIVINRPFFFAIREMKSGLILFAGSVNNPAQTGL
jgi:serpin B